MRVVRGTAGDTSWEALSGEGFDDSVPASLERLYALFELFVLPLTLLIPPEAVLLLWCPQ